MSDLLREAWNRLQPALAARVGEAAHSAWVAGLRPLALERGVAYLEARNRLIADQVQRLYLSEIEACLEQEFGLRVVANLVVAPDALAPDRLEVSPVQPVLDEGNRTAYLVLQALLGDRPLPGRLFFFHGPSGTGKSFLLRWWATRTRPQPLWFDLPRLFERFQRAAQVHQTDALRAELSADAPLVLDEVHRVAGKPEFQTLLRAVLAARELVPHVTILASRWHPREIWGLDPGLGTRMLAGFVARLDQPGPAARLQYLRALEGTPSRNGRAEAIERLARSVHGSYPDVRRAWVVERQGIAPEIASHYLRLIDPRSVFQRVLARVETRLGVAAAEVQGKSQHRRVSLARQILALACVREGLSQAEVARFLGGRTRASVHYAIHALEQRMQRCAETRRRVEEVLS